MKVSDSKGSKQALGTWAFTSAVLSPILLPHYLTILLLTLQRSLILEGTCNHELWLKGTKSREGFAGVKTEDGLQCILSSPMGSMSQPRGRTAKLFP